MSETPVFGTGFYVGMQQWRDLESDFPALKPYLSRGLDVLDVGCGPATLTLGEETLQAARQELEAWHNHPHAFHMIAGVFAAGRVG